jgi:benzoyl-CoA reductase/2-hydroxyglutaryl-CoA dehydratase subunit BcrC/BadD/HgdB
MVGYFPGGYVPEEIIYAAGAIPLCLCEGGNYRAAEAALSVVPPIICPFARAQIGEMTARTNPYYGIVDLVVAPITCQHLKQVAEVWESRQEADIFKLGVPHQRGDIDLEYFTERLRTMGERLSKLTGRDITDDGLNTAIALYDRMGTLLNEIDLMRRDPLSPVTTKDFIALNHASFYADPVFMVEELEKVIDEFRSAPKRKQSDRPRLLLMGPNLVPGDTAILDIIERAGGDVVVEEFFEGVRYRRKPIGHSGDPLDSLARSYLLDRLPPAFMRSSTGKRLDYAFELVRDYQCSGAVWYEILCCETYDQESYLFFKQMNEKGIPALIVESDYSKLDAGPLRTRLGAFMEVIKGGPI